ncbi:hypothetical protein D9M72_555590 [compost metagenome]
MRKRHVGQSQLRDDGPLRQLRNGLPHHSGQREHRVHQTLAEGLPGAPGRVKVQRLGVHGHGGEQDVVRLGHRPARAVGVDHSLLKLVEVEAPLFNDARAAGG